MADSEDSDEHESAHDASISHGLPMRLIVVLLCAASVLFAFGGWGLWSAAGRRAFDEMDGLYPFFALVLAGVLLGVACVITLVRFVRRHRSSRPT